METTVKAVRRADPTAKVGISASSHYTEELLRYMDHRKLDFFGGSSWGQSGWAGKKKRYLSKLYGKEWYIIGGGPNKQPHFWHTVGNFNAGRAKASAARTAPPRPSGRPPAR